MTPPWTTRVADALFSTNPRRRLRLVQTSLAIACTMPSVVLLAYAVWLGFTPAGQAIAWIGVVLCGCAGFFTAIRGGWSERFTDPSLTQAQMLFASLCSAVAYAILGELRAGVFPLVMIALLFSIFSLTQRQVLVISAVALALFSSAMMTMAQIDPGRYPAAIEWGHFLMLATLMPATALLAGRLHALRERMRRQRKDLALALEKIEYLATRDDLTGLVNRRHARELIDAERQRRARGGAPFCLALIDLDHFKRINDRHGHGAGDAVLRAFAEHGLRTLRNVDTLGRWGGEEFMLLMPGTTLPQALAGVERLRLGLESLAIAYETGELLATLSAGVVQHGDDETVAQSTERADAALYRAKADGRNRVVTG